jgi:hypothetical protein
LSSLREATEDPEAETLPDHILQVDYSRTSGGQATDWNWTRTSEIANPEHPAPEPTVETEGTLPEGVCQAARYPGDSALAYVLLNYAYECQ